MNKNPTRREGGDPSQRVQVRRGSREDYDPSPSSHRVFEDTWKRQRWDPRSVCWVQKPSGEDQECSHQPSQETALALIRSETVDKVPRVRSSTSMGHKDSLTTAWTGGREWQAQSLSGKCARRRL